jgi:hypothetical protein
MNSQGLTPEEVQEVLIEEYGKDFIVVHRFIPKNGRSYFITSSPNVPAVTESVIIELAERMKP